MFVPQKLKLGFIILNSESNPSLLKNTVHSIRSKYDSPIISVTEKNTKKESFQEMNSICPTCKGGSTYTSLINAGMEHPPSDWNFIIIAGTHIRQKIDKKYSMFVKNEKDILYPILNFKYEFSESSINGLFLHKNSFKEIGKMADIGPLDICKLMWQLDAIEKGYTFKAILGNKFC